MDPARYQIAENNRVRLSIYSSTFPEYDPNTNAKNQAFTDTKTRIAKQTVFQEEVRPSRLLVPVIEL